MAKGCNQDGIKKWFQGPLLHLAAVYFLHSWGESLWQFALGLYLVYIEEGVLRLAAIFGFAGAGCILLFMGILGHWLDRTSRLKAIKVTLFVQDIAVVMLSCIIFLVLMFESSVSSWSNGLWGLLAAVFLMFSIIAQLFGLTFKIAMEKDWFVVVSAGDHALLARINSVTRSLDQACGIVAPLVAGAIMTHISLKVAALIISGYTLVAVFLKLFLLLKLYKLVPSLAREKAPQVDEDDATKDLKCTDGKLDGSGASQPMIVETGINTKAISNDITQEKDSMKEELNNTSLSDKNVSGSDDDGSPVTRDRCSGLKSVCNDLLVLFTGWRVYVRQKVVLAGLGLAFLYMTVLSFHAITIGYIYASGISESIIGILTGLSGVSGILGSIIFPTLRNRLGVERTGIFGFWFEIGCLTLPLISIWLPGSPFDPGYIHSEHKDEVVRNCSHFSNSSSGYYAVNNFSSNGQINVMLDGVATLNTTMPPGGCDGSEEKSPVTVSIVVFLIGVIMSRTGLWIADLSVTQIIQETVAESERGVVNGIQYSLSMVFEILMYVLVIILPYVQTYGILVILSYIFLMTGGIMFLLYCRIRKGVAKCCGSEEVKNDEDDEVDVDV